MTQLHVLNGSDDPLRRRRLTARRRELLELLAARSGPVQLADLPPGKRQGDTVGLLYAMRHVGLVRLVQVPGHARTPGTHNANIDRIEITQLGRDLLGGEPVLTTGSGAHSWPVHDDDTRAVAQDVLLPPIDPLDERLNPWLERDTDAPAPTDAPSGPLDNGAAPDATPDVQRPLWPVLTALRDRQARQAVVARLLREAAELTTDTELGVQLLQHADTPVQLSDAEAEYLAHMAALDDDGGQA